MRRALLEYQVRPIRTTIPFHIAVMQNERFKSGHYTTGFIAQEFGDHGLDAPAGDQDIAIIAAALHAHLNEKKPTSATPAASTAGESTPVWRLSGRLRRL